MNLSDIVHVAYLGRDAAVDAEKLLVHESSEWQAVERIHTLIVELLRVLRATCMTLTLSNVLHPIQHKIGHFEDALPSLSLG